MKTKTISLLLVLAMCLLLFAGCQDARLHSLSEEETGGEESPEVSEAPEQTGPKDYSAAYEAYPADQVMLTVDGIDITWGELFYWYVYDVSNIENYFGAIEDWDAISDFDSTRSTREYVTENAITTISNYCSLEKKAAELGIEMTEMDIALTESAWQEMVSSYGGGSEETLLSFLKTAYLTKEVFTHITHVNQLYTRVSEELYGVDGEKILDRDLYSVAEDMGYMRVKHIFLSTRDDTNTELPAEMVTEQEAKANELYGELSAITDPTALEARVDELIASDSEDPGSAYYTAGYTFVYGDFNNPSFESAAQELGEYELSGVVKTELGFHIILRLPLDRTAPVNYISETEFTTLGTPVSQELFSAEAELWAKDVSIETTAAYDALDLAAVFELANKAAADAAAAASAEPTDGEDESEEE